MASVSPILGCYKRIKDMKIVVQFVQNYLSQPVPAVVISVDAKRYLFNVPSSFQRYFRTNNQVKLSSGTPIFFTEISPLTVSGLPGFMLSMFLNPNFRRCCLFLDERGYNHMERMRYKFGWKIMSFSYMDWSGRARIGVDNMKWIMEKGISMTTKDKEGKHFESFVTQNVEAKFLQASEVFSATSFYNQNNQTFRDDYMTIKPVVVSHSNGRCTTAFICSPKDQPGKVLADKLKQFGIAGAQIAQLLKAGSIVNAKGETVTTADVKLPDQPSPKLLIIHYWDFASFASTLQHPTIQNYLVNQGGLLTTIVHIAEDHLTVISPQFNQLLGRLPASTEHVFYNSLLRNSTDSLEEMQDDLIFKIQRRSAPLNALFPRLMPNIVNIIREEAADIYRQATIIQSLKLPQHSSCLKRFYQYHVGQKKGKRLQKIAVKNPKELEEEIKALAVNLKQVSTAPTNEPCPWRFDQWDPKVVFLGTGSMKPTEHRNVSGILVEVGEADSMIFDCGEGTYSQILDHYGGRPAEHILLGIRLIFITHIHSDHNLGILHLIAERNRLIRRINRANDKLILIIPSNMIVWYESFISTVEDFSYGCEVLFIQSLTNEPEDMSEVTLSKGIFKPQLTPMCNEQPKDEEDGEAYQSEHYEEISAKYKAMQPATLNAFANYLNRLSIVEFRPTPVIHCPQSYGIIVKHASGVKISYSGDTRPSQSFAKAAANSTLLIHESTFGDDLVTNAIEHAHSTTGEAISVGIQSSSWKTALTHFSQRYTSSGFDTTSYRVIPAFADYAEKHCFTCVDHVQFRLSELPDVVLQTREVAKIYTDEEES